jgi:hypothetical protein
MEVEAAVEAAHSGMAAADAAAGDWRWRRRQSAEAEQRRASAEAEQRRAARTAWLWVVI